MFRGEGIGRVVPPCVFISWGNWRPVSAMCSAPSHLGRGNPFQHQNFPLIHDHTRLMCEGALGVGENGQEGGGTGCCASA